MTKKTIRLTSEGYKALEQELVKLSGEGREKVKRDLEVARSYGDLSENSEYDEAKNAQGQLEARIRDIEATLQNAVIEDGFRIKVLNQTFNQEAEYVIVSASEAEPEDNKISDESPVGEALLNRSVGDEVAVNLPNGVQVKFTVLEVG